MALRRTSMRSFLASAKAAAKVSTPRSRPVTFVVGNESAGRSDVPSPFVTLSAELLSLVNILLIQDLDSICSALVYSYIRSQIPPYDLHIPLANLAREDISLRTELKPVLEKAQLQPDDLITLSDLFRGPSSAGASSIIRDDCARLILVDHNALTGDLAKLYGSQVVGCIDHHEDEGVVPNYCGSEPRLIKKSGSCASLVVLQCRKAWETIIDDQGSLEEAKTWNAEVAQLALAPILIDTNNLQDKHKKTEIDEKAVELLLEILGDGFDRDSYFREISEAKQDIGGLTLDDILRKDYKMWEESGIELGISSAVKDVSFLIDKAGSDALFIQSLREFAKARSLAIFAVMTTSNCNNLFTRELLVLALGDDAVRICCDFEERSSTTLGLKPWKDGRLDRSKAGEWPKCWIQERVEHSRKQVAPLLRKSMNEKR